MFVSPAFAQSAGAAGQVSLLESIAPFGLILIVFYFLLIRPQQKKMKDHREMLNNIRRGDKVVTAGGIHAKVTKDNGESLECEIADGVKVTVERNLVSHLQAKTQPVADKNDEDGSGDTKASKNDNKQGGLRGLLTGKN